MPESTYVEVRRFRLLHEAELAAATLEASGIESEVRDNFLAAAEPELVNAVGGIALFVDSVDVPSALEILSAETEIVSSQGDDVDTEATCAGCGAPLRSAFVECTECNGLSDRPPVRTPKSAYIAIVKLKLGVAVLTLGVLLLPFCWTRLVRALQGFSDHDVSVIFYSVAGVVVAGVLFAGLRKISETPP